jgi:hypothetical protein
MGAGQLYIPLCQACRFVHYDVSLTHMAGRAAAIQSLTLRSLGSKQPLTLVAYRGSASLRVRLSEGLTCWDHHDTLAPWVRTEG